jgi:hypothetical protein
MHFDRLSALEKIMKTYQIRRKQSSCGQPIGILLLEQYSPFIPGDVANATTYEFPVRFQKVKGFSIPRAIGQDKTIYDDLLEAAQELVEQGVRAVTGDCGFMGIHQKKLASTLDVPVFLSSLIQINFISTIISQDDRIGIITANSQNLGLTLLEAVGVQRTDNLVIRGMQDQPCFAESILNNSPTLDQGAIEQEVVAAARDMVEKEPSVKAILMECSMLPPYSAAVQEATGLPVFDYISMINYVYSAVVQRRYEGYL